MGGEPATMLRGELLQSLQLHRARTVDMCLMVDGRLTKKQRKGTDYRIAEFCDLLMALLPAATIFNIGAYEAPGVRWNHKGKLVTMLLHSLDRHATRLQLEICTSLPIPVLEAYPLANLTSFAALLRSTDMMAQMIALNSQSLRVLDSVDMGMGFLKTVIGSDGASISYPRLTRLVVRSFDHNPSQHKPLATTGCPFPTLRHLGITTGYPFSDGTPFRGNHETLESLDLAYGIQAFRVLNEYLAANGAMLCSLRHQSISHVSWEVGNDGEAMLAAIAPIIQRAPSLQNMYICMSSDYRGTFDVIAWLGFIPKQLRMLSVKGRYLNANEFIMLLRELPSLESLTCGLRLFDEIYTSHLDNLSTRTIPLNARFRRWTPIINCLRSDCNNRKWNRVHFLIGRWNKMLAGLCPNFTYRKTW